MKIYHNPRCSKSRCALDYLKTSNFTFEVRDYMKEPFTATELREVLTALNYQPSDLLRKNEEEYKNHIQGKELTEDQIFDFLLQFPKLIERPIVVWDSHAVVARPLEKLTDLLDV